VNILPKFMGRSIRDDAIKAEAELLAGAQIYGPGEHPSLLRNETTFTTGS
jgi:putative transport protein